MLTITVLGGLCNRLRVLLSALSIAQQCHVEVNVEWEENAECQARFEDLFVPIDSGRFHVREMHWWARPSRRKNLHLPRLLRYCMGYTFQRDGYVPSSLTDLQGIALKHKRAFISSGCQLADYPLECMHRIKPVAELQGRIDHICQHFTKDTVGVHIRRTDNAKSIEGSPIESFLQAMAQEVKAHPQATFFLATDDTAVKEMLCKRFPKRIFTQSEPASRNTLDGMRNAVVDLWCLSRTSRMIGSYWSSFTDAAAELGQIPLTIANRSMQASC